MILNRSQSLSGKRPISRMLDDCELMLTIYSGNCQRRPDSLSQTASEVLAEGGRMANLSQRKSLTEDVIFREQGIDVL